MGSDYSEQLPGRHDHWWRPLIRTEHPCLYDHYHRHKNTHLLIMVMSKIIMNEWGYLHRWWSKWSSSLYKRTQKRYWSSKGITTIINDNHHHYDHPPPPPPPHQHHHHPHPHPPPPHDEEEGGLADTEEEIGRSGDRSVLIDLSHQLPFSLIVIIAFVITIVIIIVIIIAT